ncbi:reverse transcriptase N-terminal domain-containing protein [Neobacillus drentensis]|uniref:reverse transcriptase N-terminal domain-containing protein n=1 Tax=Neobacillus drentensis TaxID=220684 RepID=UPI002FFEE5E8
MVTDDGHFYKEVRITKHYWDSINWLNISQYVEKFQQRIYHAERFGKIRKVRDLQRLLIKSQAALLLSIRRVTQINKGKRTAGVDGYKALTPFERVELYNKMKDFNINCHRPKPTYRTYIEKKNGKLRPLGIPTMKDRIYQNIARLALEPQWEAKFEPTSYGFRPKRNCHDAIERIFNTIGNKKKWIFEGDSKAVSTI